MKIIHIITGLRDGGAEAVLYRLCKNDRTNEHVVVSLSSEGKYGKLLEAQGIEIRALNLSLSLSSLKAIYSLYRLIRNYKPDVVQTWMYHANLIGGLIAKFAGSKGLFWGVHHSVLIKAETKKSTYLIAKANAYLSCWLPRKIIYCADSSLAAQEALGFDKSKGEVVYNGYNTSEFDANEQDRFLFREEVGATTNDILVGHVGRYDSNKDYKNLMEALGIIAQQYSNLSVILVGSGLDTQNSELLSLIDKYKLTEVVRLEGRREDIPRVMNGIDLMVLSSKSEAFPNVLNEAMACKTPCVSTDVGDSKYIIGDTGWIAPKQNSRALSSELSKALTEKLNDENAWMERRDKCRERIEAHFSVEKMIERYHNVWGLNSPPS
jgi:glycosyltransferase involved in cell wall biosynthesis